MICIKRVHIKKKNYGTGKTLYAFKLAIKAIANGWTFLYCPNPEKVLYVMQVADMLSKNGKGVVIFMEDIDKVLHERTGRTNEISLLMDGGETKNKNVITILTTNHIERIDPTFLRGKRIGSIVTLTYPDKNTAKKMIDSYLVDEFGESLLEEDCDTAAQVIADNKIVPAFIAEILERVKSHLIYSGKTTVNCDDIINSVKSYKKQMEIATVNSAKLTPVEDMVQAIKEVFPSSSKEDLKTVVNEVLTAKGFK